LKKFSDVLGDELVSAILHADQKTEKGLAEQRARGAGQVQARRDNSPGPRPGAARRTLVRRSVWILGGDGWAYDIGYGGLDHVLSTGRNVNVLVLDTEVYSNTGGQASKSTPIGAVAKFAATGKGFPKKDLGLIAQAYGYVYVARIAMGANDAQTVRAFQEAEAYDGPSLIIAYSHCIAHGFALDTGLEQQKLAVQSGHWPLYRYNPELVVAGNNGFQLDSKEPSIELEKYVYNETRYKMLLAQDKPRPKCSWPGQGGDRLALDPTPVSCSPEQGRELMADLSTSYLGLKLANPLVASASPISKKIDNVRKLEDAGIGAVVVYSLFEEQILHEEKERDHFLNRASNMHPEALDYFPDLGNYNLEPDQYLAHLAALRKAVKIPVVGSLNGVTRAAGRNGPGASSRPAWTRWNSTSTPFPSTPRPRAPGWRRRWWTWFRKWPPRWRFPWP
jgi:pyruvate/2-oxoacid:ferredoxin oxidoreductase beta subunit